MNLKTVLQISAKELRYLIYSPIGWIVLVVFWLQSAARFHLGLSNQLERFALGRGPDSFAETLFTVSVQSVFQQVIWNAHLYIPLITMAVFARELQSGAIKLFMSSPVRPAEIVLGKFAGVATFLLLFVVSLFSLVLVSVVSIRDFDFAATLPGLLGIYLLVCTYAAIGLFVSSLTRYQVVAAITTLAVLFVLRSIAGWFQATPVINEITYWASLLGRAEAFRAGLIATDNIVYFVSLIGLFLGLTILRISNLRSGETIVRVGVKGLGIVMFTISAGWALSMPQMAAYFDTTFDRRNSLAPESVELMERLQGPWEIVTYANIIDGIGSVAQPRSRIRDKERYRVYRQFNPSLSMSYQPYYDFHGAREIFRKPDDGRSDEEIIAPYARRVGLDPDYLPTGPELDAETHIDLAAEGFRSIRVLRWNGREAILRHFYDSFRFPGERTRAAGVKSLLDGPRVVGVLSGKGERSVWRNSPSDYEQNFTRLNERFSLINHGFVFEEIRVSDAIPEHIDILLIADPKTDYSPARLTEVLSYIESGRDAAVLVDPASASSVDLILADLGLARGASVTQDNQGRYSDELVFAMVQEGVLDQYWGASNRDYPVALDGGVALEALNQSNGFLRQPTLIVSDSNSSGHLSGSGSHPTGIVMGYALERGTEGSLQRIAVFGDADVFSNANLQRTQPFTTTATGMEIFHWLTEGAYPVQRTRREPIDGEILIGDSTLTKYRWLLLGGVPLFILGSGGALLLKRKRK